jgi:hypothetical protein
MTSHGQPGARLKAVEVGRKTQKRLEAEELLLRDLSPTEASFSPRVVSVRRPDQSGRGGEGPSSLTAVGLTALVKTMRAAMAAKKS